MALQITFTDDLTGVEYTDSYHKIVSYRIDEMKNKCFVSVGIYKDVAHRALNKAPLFISGFPHISLEFNGELLSTALSSASLDVLNSNPKKVIYGLIKELTASSDCYKRGVAIEYKNNVTDV